MATKISTQRLQRSYRQVQGQSISNGTDSIVLTSSRTGVQNPFYRQQILNRVDATTPLTASSETIKLSDGYIQFTENSSVYNSSTRGGYQYSNLKGAVTGNLGDTLSYANAKAAQDYYKQLNNIRRSLSGQQLIGEFHQTIDLLKHPFREGINLLQSFLSVRKKDRKTGKKSSAIGSQWLQVRFGLLPLVSDIDGLLSALSKTFQKEDVRSYKAFGKAELSEVTPGYVSDIYGFNVHGERIRVQRSKVYYSFGYLHHLMSDSDAKLNDLHESFANMRDIPATLWEVMPWSWLVDYFVNVGSIIEAVCTSESNVVYVSKSVITEQSVTFQYTQPVPVASRFVLQEFRPMIGTYQSRTVSRTSGPVGIPPLVFNLPRNKIQLMNIAAILLQQLK